MSLNKIKERKQEDTGLPVWFAPRDIYFSRIQLESFLLPELNNLRKGYYPTEPDEYITYVKGARVEMKRSGYDKSGKRPTNHIAPFIVAAEIAAEIDARLKMCPLGWLVQSYYTDGFTFEEIAAACNGKQSEERQKLREISKIIPEWSWPEDVFKYCVTEEWVRWEIGKMVRYLAGWKRRVDKDTKES